MHRETELAERVRRMAPDGDLKGLLGERLKQRGARAQESMAGSLEGMGERRVFEDTLDALAAGKPLSAAQRFVTEALILPELRPALFVRGDRYGVVDHPTWLDLNTKVDWRANLEKAIPSVGRIELPYRHRDDLYAGTGWVVGDGLLMTNRHVAEIFASGLGDRAIRFRNGRDAGLNLKREIDDPGRTLMVDAVAMIHPFWDCALLRVSGLPASAKPLTLANIPTAELRSRKVAAIGYPAFDPRNPVDEQDDLFDEIFQVKRLQPGELGPVAETASFGKLVPALTHDCSTLGGNSGSALVDLETGLVVGLHFGGAYRDSNFAVPSAALCADRRVLAAGARVAGPAPADESARDSWWSLADARPARAEDPPGPNREPASSGRGASPSAPVQSPDSSVTFTVPLHVTVRLGGSAPAAAVAGAGEGIVEKLVEPVRDADYRNRKGYDPAFLAADDGSALDRTRLAVPLPEVVDGSVVAATRTGERVLAYEHFSVVMHRTRRLALVTASNVTDDPRLREPEPGRSYTRKALNWNDPKSQDREKWFPDPRLDPEAQLHDHFFEYDDKSFDKGHLVRRDDVAWGRTFAEAQRANGDSFHVTNCSPQISSFNQSSDGEDNWGDLENAVLSQAASQRLCVLAGPVLAADDVTVLGRAPGNRRIRVQIPARYWKVVVARSETGLEAFGFVLEQDLDGLPNVVEGMELAFEEFKQDMRKLSEIERMTGLAFDRRLHEADQWTTVRGADIAHLAGAARR